MSREMIRQKLREIETTEHVRILYAAEAGSRAWGTHSADSDYDVRFVYVRPPEYYWRLDKTRDVIEWQLDDVWDISGWDVKKALSLLQRSNPTLFEWNGSPIVYRCTPSWEAVASLLPQYFVPRTALYHYYGIAKRTFLEELQREQVKLKRYFYVLRPLLACRWIADRQTPPPVRLSDLADGYLDERMKSIVQALLRQKAQSGERDILPRHEMLCGYLQSLLTEAEERLSGMPSVPPASWEALNSLFISLVQEAKP